MNDPKAEAADKLLILDFAQRKGYTGGLIRHYPHVHFWAPGEAHPLCHLKGEPIRGARWDWSSSLCPRCAHALHQLRLSPLTGGPHANV